jgi:hypothetical protein
MTKKTTQNIYPKNCDPTKENGKNGNFKELEMGNLRRLLILTEE